MAKKIPKEILRCPGCFSEKLIYGETMVSCASCGGTYPYKDDKVFFETLMPADIHDPVDKIKYFFKKYPQVYDFLRFFMSPCVQDQTLKRFLRQYVKNEDLICLNLASGYRDISPHVSNVDIFAYDNVDMTCNAENLPLKDHCVDIIINDFFLEHIPDPGGAIDEMRRVLKKGGLVYCSAPFIFNFHSSPGDYTRWTIEGFKNLYKDFEILELNLSGPISGLLSIAREAIAMIGSFGIRPLYLIIYFIVIWLTFPLKFLDIILKHHPFAKNITAVFYMVARKSENAG